MIKGQRAVVLAPGKVALEQFALPPPPPGQVLLRARRTLISPGTERAFFLSLENTNASYPLYPGYSFAGEVIACGADVSALRVGDAVLCAAPHASHALVPAGSCLKAPPDLPADEAVFFNLMAIAMQGVRKARLELGESVAVLGAGLIGILSLRLAQLAGGLPVISMDLDAQRLELARALGADATVLGGEGSGAALRRLLHGAGADVIIEATGAPAALAAALQLAADKGRVILLGSPRGAAQNINFYPDLHRRGLMLIGAHEITRPLREDSPGYWTQRREHRVCRELLARRRVQPRPLITHTYPWRDFPQAYAHLKNWDRAAMGILIQWT